MASHSAATSSSPLSPPPILHAIGGSLGGAFALLLLYPLERARIELQKSVSEHHHRNQQQRPKESSLLDSSWDSMGCDDNEKKVQDIETKKGEPLIKRIHQLWERNELYRGVAPIVLTLATSNFVFFYMNEFMKQILLPTQQSSSSASAPQRTISKSQLSLLASCLAGICNVLLTNPLWVANLRIVTEECSSSSLIREMRRIAKQESLGNLWSGTGTSLLLVSNPVLQFFVYEELKLRQLTSISSFSPARAFVTGALAKTVATILTYPLQLAQAVLRMQKNNTDDRNADDDDSNRNTISSGTWECLRKIYLRDGTAGLFTGMRAKLLQTVLTAAFTFLSYEQIIAALHAAQQSLILSSRQRQQRVMLQ